MDRLWLKREDALTLVGMEKKGKAFRANIQAALDSVHIRKTAGRGEPLEFWAPAIVERLLELAGEATPDPELAGEGSLALERFRQARAGLAECELALRKGDLMPRTEVHEGCGLIASIYRRAGARLRKQFGDEAYQIVEEAWDDAQRMIDRRFGDA